VPSLVQGSSPVPSKAEEESVAENRRRLPRIPWP